MCWTAIVRVVARRVADATEIPDPWHLRASTGPRIDEAAYVDGPVIGLDCAGPTAGRGRRPADSSRSDPASRSRCRSANSSSAPGPRRRR